MITDRKDKKRVATRQRRACHYDYVRKGSRVLELTNRLVRDEHGVALVEYGFLVGFIAVACFAAVQLLGIQINTFFTFVSTALAPVI